MSTPEGTQTDVYAESATENDTDEAALVEEIESKVTLSDAEAVEADQRALAELEELANRGEEDVAAAEELFLPAEEGAGLTPAKLKLSAHFNLSEFHCKDAARTHVPAIALPALKRLVNEVLEPMRAKFGSCTVWSGFRTDAKNAEVDGKPNSWHLYHKHSGKGVAADITFAQGTPSQWANEAEHLVPNSGLGRYPSFIHVDNRPGRARW